MSEEMIIQYCSPTLAGLKTGNMFTCSFENEDALRNTVRDFNRRYSHKGILFLSLRFRNGKALIYIYRPAHLARDLKHETARSILKNNGYNPDLPGRCIFCLREKLMNCDSFPHEIGLFLGYPPEDVKGFIEQGAKCCKCSGCWKVYFDEDNAMKTFRKLGKCREVYCRKYAEGYSVDKLIVNV
ncbi:MAG: DUF3793 family protein [Clostridia bacterium]|nr:DUF3793 family protein [Clostridia bacterium]